MVTIKKYTKTIANVFLLDIIISLVFPSLQSTYALTSGPGSPEFSSFEPVATTDMVNPSTGDFTYNLPVIQIPGPDGAGYAMSLSYHSGVSPEEEASWVGYGWSLNPGAINRDVRGIPDEYNGTEIDYYNKSEPNWSMAGSNKLNLEFFSNSQSQGGQSVSGGKGFNGEDRKSQFSVSASNSLRYNNYQGFSKVSSLGLSVGYASLSMNNSNTGTTFSAEINPFYKRRNLNNEHATTKAEKQSIFFDKIREYAKGNFKIKGKEALKSAGRYALANGGSTYGYCSFTDVGRSVQLDKISGYNLNYSDGLQVNPSLVPVGIEAGSSGSFNISYTNGREIEPAYGYLHTKSGYNGRKDYSTEKNQAFDKRDYFLGIPFSSPDSYMLTGEGLSGGFRAYTKDVGHYTPQGIDESQTNINTFGLGLETMIGANIGVGVSLAFGSSKSKLGDWRHTGNTTESKYNFTPTTGKDYVYRFNGDMGGQVLYGDNTVTTARLEVQPDIPMIRSAQPFLPEIGTSIKDRNESNSSSYIKEKGAGFSILNEGGVLYTYDEPVQVKNSTNLSVDVLKGVDPEYKYIAYSDVYLRKIGTEYKVDRCAQQTAHGEIKRAKHTSSLLLTSITTPDYIEIGEDGPDAKDFGGWTKFEYHKKYGLDNPYRWRIPYNGLLYDRGSLTDPKDDTGYLDTGEKEVKYLKKIETKTHIAYFVTNKTTPDRFKNADGTGVKPGQEKYLTGTGVVRFDGLGAINLSGTTDPAGYAGNHKNVNAELEYLEKIVLFAKARPDKPLQITNFAYDYMLMANLPNNKNGNYPSNITSSAKEAKQSGKLTLRKVWSEFEGVVRARTSSYQFGYSYKDQTLYDKELREDHSSLTDFFNLSHTYTENAQNPDYAPHAIGAWGTNQYDGGNRHLRMQKWLYQGKIDKKSYDPAAWHLKQIKLPSGGEILIEYEEEDYAYVQDRLAMGLVKLVRNSGDNTNTPTYDLDIRDIGYGTEPNEDVNRQNTKDLVSKLQSYFKDRRIYFKFLYALEGTVSALDNPKSEYITGYARVEQVSETENPWIIRIQLNGSGGDDGYNLTPKQGCYDYYSTQRWGKLDKCHSDTNNCEGNLEARFGKVIRNGIANPCSNVVEDIGSVALSFGFVYLGIKGMSALAFAKTVPDQSTVCLSINPELSYLKIPMFKAKRGGGARVKRLFMYDKGIETGDQAIYGSSYSYKLEDGTTSGVASNEPQAMREENALVDFLPKKDQTWFSRLAVGKDKEQSEGPIGETLLPSPSITYSRVVVENIYKGKTGTGHTIHEFYTCKDYPFDKNYNYGYATNKSSRAFDFATEKGEGGVAFTDLNSNSKSDRIALPVPGFYYGAEHAWATQGFRFIINEMNGKPKSVKTYGGSYTAGKTSYLSSGQDFEYFEPGEMVKMLRIDKEGNQVWEWGTPGKEMDVTMEKYRITNKNLDVNFEIDVSAGMMVFPPIFGSGSLAFSFSEQNISKHATSKVIRYPAMQKKVTTYADNITSFVENIGYDHATGKAILTKTTDAYHGIPLANTSEVHDGSIYSLNIPAYWHYEKMGRASEGNHTNKNILAASAGSVVTYGKGANPFASNDGKWVMNNKRIISSSANTYSTMGEVATWMNTNVEKLYTQTAEGFTPDQRAKFNSIWRPHKSYVYKGQTANSSETVNTPTTNAFNRVYDGGIYTTYKDFNYKTNAQEDKKWIKVSEVTQYSPHGNVLEEKNVLGIYSAAKFGYNFTQPTMISSNSQYTEMYFEDYENKTIGVVFKGHSGDKSFVLEGSTSEIVSNVHVNSINEGGQLASKGAWLKLWIKNENKTAPIAIAIKEETLSLERVAQVGDWSLYRKYLPASLFTAGEDVKINLINNWSLDNTQPIYIDDVKFQPKEAQSTCYVYDVKSLRLITQFDDQHFGMYYQYNGEGKLVRKLIETERGLKTISETQYNTPREDR